MSRMLFVSTDGHAGLLPGGYRDYLDPEFREAYDADVAVQLELASLVVREPDLERTESEM